MNRLFASSSSRNVAFNLAGQLLPLVVAFVTVPKTIALLGADRFGLLALALTTLGISTILDVSVGRTITKFCSDALECGERDRPGVILRSALLLQALVGLAFAGAVFAAAPFVILKGLKIPLHGADDACAAFRILAAAAIPNLVLGAFRAFLEAHRRFDLVNLVRGPGAALSFLLPWIGARYGWSLAAIALSLLLARVGLLGVFGWASARVEPDLMRGGVSARALRSLAAFSGFVAASEAIPALLATWDQFLLGLFVSLGAVASYSVPNEIVLRLWVIPMSVTAAFFPVLSAAWTRRDWAETSRTLRRCASGTLILLAGPVLVLILGAPRLLSWWMGARFAATSAVVLQILSGGMLLGSLTLVATALLQAAGHPELPTRLRLSLAPVWLFGQWKMTQSWGLLGAAAGVAMRSSVDLVFLAVLSYRTWRYRPDAL